MTTETSSPPQTPHAEHPGEVITVGELLSDGRLRIPGYQRPYKWTGKNVRQLFADLATHLATSKDRAAYRLGTIVFHEEEGRRDIVDGQQRTVSLMLAVLALHRLCMDKLKRPDLRAQLDALAGAMHRPLFTSDISKKNIGDNYLEISRIVTGPEFTEESIDFLLNRCQVVTFTLTDISEAFQFFDSQNARGRDLEPHDLLKAYHLREFDEGDETLKARTVADWENSESETLASLFAGYLYRVRQWSRGDSARHFGKDDIALFKGLNLATSARHPFTEPLRIAHHFIDRYNRGYERDIDGRAMAFPFQLDQVIVNGRRFFEMTAHYRQQVARLRQDPAHPEILTGHPLDDLATRIMRTINDYPGMHRTGDRYVRAIFDCLLLQYIDKFGHAEISRAIKTIFVWAYSLRLSLARVSIASADSHARGQNLFRVVMEAVHPGELIHCPLPTLRRVVFENAEKIETLFREMRYV